MARERLFASAAIRWGGLALGMAALLAAGEAMAADFRCADLRPSQSQTPPYQRIAGQARCEGFFDQHVSQPFIELVSLTASAPPKQEQGVLELRASRRAAVQLVVQPLRPAPFYRVDALVEAAQAMRWDDAQMLGATGLRRRDIGFLALAPGPDGMPTYVPVTFADAGEAPEVASGVLRASVPVARLAWRSLRGDGSDDGSGGWHDLPGPARFAWERVPIELQLPRGGRGVQINVQATDAAGKILPLLRFNLAGPADAIPDDVAALERARAEAARRLAERAGDPAALLPELRDLRERLQLIDAGLAARAAPSRGRRWPPALWPALAVAVLVSIAAAVPVGSVPFTLEAKASSVGLQLDAAGDLGPQAVDGELRLEGQTRLESPAASLAEDAAAAGGDALSLRAQQLVLRRVGHPAGSLLVVQAGPQVHLTLDAPRAVVRVDVEFSGPTQWRLAGAGAAKSADFAHAEWLRASAGDAAQAERRPPPLDLWLGLAPGKAYAWSHLRPSALQFVERRADDARQAAVASSLEQARIALPATGAEVRLGAGDRLDVAGLELERFELAASDSVTVRLSGTARVLATRTGDFERSLKPSLLEYIARHHTVGMAWSAALFLWGAVTWIRKQFDGVAP